MAVDSILEWNQVLLNANANDHAQARPDQAGPVMTARAFSIVSVAMYDALNSVETIGRPYRVTAPQAKNSDVDAAVAQAAHDTLVALYPSQADTFDDALVVSLNRIPDGQREERGRSVGRFVAERILAARSKDGSDSFGINKYEANGLPGFHDVDPLHPDQGFYGSTAMDMKPFVVRSLDQFVAPRLDDGTPAGRAAFLQSDMYTAAYDEVLSLGGDGIDTPTSRTDEQTEIGIFWGYDGRPGLGTPPRLFNQIARVVAEQQGNTEAQNARLFALLNLSMADAGMTAWNNKYDDAFWRPILGIREGDVDGNSATVGDSNWKPLGDPASNPRPGETDFTPPFPAYTSGHATFGAAAFQTLERFYGRDRISFSFTSDEFNGITKGADGEVRPIVTRDFDSFSQAKLENAQSRIYLGVHWSFDATEGIATGDAVADYVFEHSLQSNRNGQRPHRHNQNRPCDVNDDGVESILDVLALMSELRSNDNNGTENFADVNNDGSRTAGDLLLVVNQLRRQLSHANSRSLEGESLSAHQNGSSPKVSSLVYSYVGIGNELSKSALGSALETLLRRSPGAQADGVATSVGPERSTAREMMDLLSKARDGATPSAKELAAYVDVWSQLGDYDLDLTTSTGSKQAFNNQVSLGDSALDPFSRGNSTHSLVRSSTDSGTGSERSKSRK